MTDLYEAPKNRLHAIADAMAERLGGQRGPSNESGEYFEWTAKLTVPVKDEVPAFNLILRTEARDKVKARMELAEASKHSRARGNDPSIGFRGTRSLDEICKTVSRRLVHNKAAVDHLIAERRREDAQQALDAQTEQSITALERAGCRRDMHRKEAMAGPEGQYLLIDVYGDKVTISRIGSVTVKQMLRILDVLAEGDD